MMQRRDFLATLAGGLLASEAAAQSKTNFVFILADDLGARHLGCYAIATMQRRIWTSSCFYSVLKRHRPLYRELWIGLSSSG